MRALIVAILLIPLFAYSQENSEENTLLQLSAIKVSAGVGYIEGINAGLAFRYRRVQAGLNYGKELWKFEDQGLTFYGYFYFTEAIFFGISGSIFNLINKDNSEFAGPFLIWELISVSPTDLEWNLKWALVWTHDYMNPLVTIRQYLIS